MSEEIKLPSDLATAINKYLDMWSKFYPVVRTISSDILYFVLKELGYLPEIFWVFNNVAEYEIKECHFVLWTSRLILRDIHQHPEIDVMDDYFKTGEAVMLDINSKVGLSFFIRGEYHKTVKNVIFWFRSITLTKDELVIRSEIGHNDEISNIKLEYSIERDILKYRKGIEIETNLELSTRLRKLSISATRLFLDDERDNLIRALNCATGLLNKVYQPTLIYLLY
jgi:hypothetical protein